MHVHACTYKRNMYARVRYVYNMYVCMYVGCDYFLYSCSFVVLRASLCARACRRLSEVSLIAGSAVASGLCTIHSIHLQICVNVCMYEHVHVQYVRIYQCM